MNVDSTLADALTETYAASRDTEPMTIANGMQAIDEALADLTLAARARIALIYVMAAYGVRFEKAN